MTAGRYRPWLGASGWYVSVERADGTHWHVPEQQHYDTKALAAEAAKAANWNLGDACSCEPGSAYLCLRCERIAEDQDIGS